MADKKKVLSAFLLILSLVPVLTTIQWQGIFFLYLAICKQRQQLIFINAVQSNLSKGLFTWKEGAPRGLGHPTL